MATPSNQPPGKPAFKIITTREQKKKFDQAVKEVVRQRQAAKGGKKPSPSQQNGPPGKEPPRFARLVQSREFEQLRLQKQGGPAGGGGGGMHHGHASNGANQRLPARRRDQSALNYSMSAADPRPDYYAAQGENSPRPSSCGQRLGRQELQPRPAPPQQYYRPNRTRSTYAGTPQPPPDHPPQPPPKEAIRQGQRRSSDDISSRRAVPENQNRRMTVGEDQLRRISFNRSASFKSSLNFNYTPDDDEDSSAGSPTKSEGYRKFAAKKRPQDGGGGDDEDDVDSKLKSLAVASTTINSIGGGDRRGRNALSLSLKSHTMGKAAFGGIGRGEVSEAGAGAGLRAMEAFLNSGDGGVQGEGGSGVGGGKARLSRRSSMGDTLLIPAAALGGPAEVQEEESGNEARAKSAANVGDDDFDQEPKPSAALTRFMSVMMGNSPGDDDGQKGLMSSRASQSSMDSDSSEGYKNFLKVCSNLSSKGSSSAAKKSLGEADEGGSGTATAGREDAGLRRVGSSRRLSNDDIATSLTGMGDIKLEDLVPTRKLSRENSARSSDLAIADRIEPVVNERGGSPREAIEVSSEASGSPRKDVAGRWREQELRSEGEGGAAGGWGEGALGKAAELFGVKPPAKSEKSPPRSVESSETLNSYATAHSREASPSPPPSWGAIEEEKSSHGDSCPRSQFVLMKSGRKSNSGGTGKTQATSTSTLFSSTRSVAENVPAAAAAKAPKNAGGGGKMKQKQSSFEAIREEEKEFRNSKNSSQREAESRDSFAAHDADHYDGNAVPGYGMYKRKKSGRIKKLRKGLRNSLLGTSSRNGNSDSIATGSGGGEGERRGRGPEYHNMEGGSQGGSTISAEQQERVSRHLQRKASNRSVTSAISSFSAITGNSDTSSTASGRVWNRFKLRGGRPKLPKSRSMYNVGSRRSGDSGVDRGGDRQLSSSHHNSRQIFVSGRHDSATSNVSNLSDDDHSAFSRNSTFTTGSGRFSDFYDHGDHAKAVSSLISHKAPSVRSLGSLALATVREPAHEGGRDGSSIAAEQKHDEDYHHRNERQLSAYHQYHENHSNVSDDSMNSFYRHPSHEHTLVHMRPNQLFPDSPGWQCDECCRETFDLNIWAYISTEKNYLMCEDCFKSHGFSVAG